MLALLAQATDDVTGSVDFSTTDSAAAGGVLAAMGAFLIVWLVIILVLIVMMILQLLNTYDLIMRDKADFPGGEQGKKSWFMKLFILPIVGGIIPLVNIVAYIVWIVFVLQYFFKVRGKSGSATPPQETPNVTPQQ